MAIPQIIKNDYGMIRSVYNFLVNGGAVSNIIVHAAMLPIGCIVKAITVNIVTGVTSGGAATISIGNSTSPTAYLAATAKGSFDTAGKLVSNSTPINYKVAVAADQDVVVGIAAAALTAGGFEMFIEYIMPLDTLTADTVIS